MADAATRTGRESGQTLVLFVSDPGNSKHGEISLLDAAQEAERTIETLLEAGFEQQRIRVFSAAQVDFEISYRPVVTLLSDRSDQATHLDHHGGNGSEGEAVDVEPAGKPSPADSHSGNGHTRAESQMSSVVRTDARNVRDEEGLTPVEAHVSGSHSGRQGRFSTLSRSACDENYVRNAIDEIA